MSIYYDGSHSITFWNLNDFFSEDDNITPFNSWDDLHLVPLQRPDVVVAEPNVHIVQIPGTDKRIDITDKLPGRLQFGKRQGQWQFAIDHYKYGGWEKSYDEIMQSFQGKRVMLCLDDDPTKVYNGEIVVTGYTPEASYTIVTIQYDLDKGYWDFSNIDGPIPPSSRFPENPPLFMRIRFIGLRKNLIDSQYKLYGASVTPPEAPEESGYKFRGWSPAIHAVTGNQDYYAQYDIDESSQPDPTTYVKYRFIYEDMETHKITVISSGKVKKGDRPTEPDRSQLPVVEGYMFKSWNPSITEIQNDTDFKAVYDIAGIIDDGKDWIEGTYINYTNDEVTYIAPYAFYQYNFGGEPGSRLKTASFAKVERIYEYGLAGCYNLERLELKNNKVVKLDSTNAIPKYAPGYMLKPCYIYVPSNLVDAYKSDSVWSSFSNEIRAL